MNFKTIQILFIIIIFSSLIISSCGHAPEKKDESTTKLVNGKPYWYWNPNIDNKIGGVGIAGIHINGKVAQRELATERAINAIARQLGVEVHNLLKTETQKINDNANVVMEEYSIQTTDGKVVKARVVEFWEDCQTNEIYVWMVENK